MPPHHLAPPEGGVLPQAALADEARAATRLLFPALAEGLIQRRPWAMARAERRQADHAAIDVVRELRARYGVGPLRLRAGPRSVALLLDPEDLARVLRETPGPFSPAPREKRRALEQFQPHGSLITRGPRREARRRVNELALDAPHPVHAVAPAVVTRVRREATALAQRAVESGLSWDGFARAWWRSVRAIVLGEAAAADEELTDRLARLRAAGWGHLPGPQGPGGWSLLAPRRRLSRAEFLLRLQAYAFQAPPDTLAGQLHGIEAEPGTDPVGQVPHWLFAFDAAGAATLRALALLSTYPQQAARARAELSGVDLTRPQRLDFLRGCVLEAVRLWPTTPLLLRESTEDTRWRGTVIPAGTLFAAYTPYFHRAEPAEPHGGAFEPGMWLDGSAERNPAFVPFSGGPAGCPGQNAVLLTASTWLAALLAHNTYVLDPPTPLRPRQPLPVTLNHFALRFSAQPG
ncbi:cytochrome P450 [Streptomyces sp. 6N223]|uniref:cytochrome P450 n=1 Tax=Streptomyces sp. 6N223 TaxID=3457412 RepID=UPI003FD3A2B9